MTFACVPLTAQYIVPSTLIMPLAASYASLGLPVATSRQRAPPESEHPDPVESVREVQDLIPPRRGVVREGVGQA
jgi:hypothetical protein